ncbi:hypothetical protein [Streptomyces sp. SAI-229]|jgi:hypothetical protein|uniref:hypothetical protein n=1 Tax=Streptomyces sp. SAI-229 TaxID=3377731 RepID=UPI003C7D55E6
MQAADDIRCLADGCVSLNCLLLSPDGLPAYTEHDPGSPVIARRGSGCFGLHYRRYGGTVVVASTGWPRPQPDWTALPERCVLEITPGSLTTTVHAAQ